MTADGDARLLELVRERALKRGEFVLSSGAKSDYYLDDRTNAASMVGIETNAGWVGALGGAATLPDGMWEICLQQFGIYRDDPICGSFVTL